MMTYAPQVRIGSLFSGYSGLDMGVQSVLGGTVAWHCEVDPAPARILAHHWPDTPNLGDITAVDWTTVEPIDILTGGFPCQDVSHAGRRAGLIRGEGGTRTGLWAEMLTAIKTLRPRLVVAENVRGLLSARADSDMEPCPWCLGDDDGRPALRALGAVLGDLADVGYDAWWTGLRAADIGAPHGRFRVFIFATPADLGAATDAGSEHREQRRLAAPGQAASWRALGQPAGRDRAPVELLPTPKASNNENRSSAWANGPNLGEAIALLPTPTTRDHKGNNQRRDDTCLTGALLPTPAASRSGRNQSLGPNAAVRPSLDGIRHLLPTPSVADALGGHLSRSGDRSGELLLPGVAKAIDRGRWGAYAPAIARWERILGRPAPDPTEPGPKGGRRLSPRFVEFLMGTPAGHTTDPAIGLTRNQQLTALGNGVVPRQAAAATRMWLAYHRQGAAA
jgi:DNA (cytosine-5)-methyltransferase 1